VTVGRHRYEPNVRLAAELAGDPACRAGLQEVCGAIAQYAIQFCPTGPDSEGNHLADHIFVGLNQLGVPIVYTDSSRWHWIEFGSVHNHPTPFFRLAVEAAGLRFEDRRGAAESALGTATT
jgi:hypothetical protein